MIDRLPPLPNSIHRPRPHGLSFADRACIALGLHERATVLTTDGKWKRLNIPLKLKLIRNEH